MFSSYFFSHWVHSTKWSSYIYAQLLCACVVDKNPQYTHFTHINAATSIQILCDDIQSENITFFVVKLFTFMHTVLFPFHSLLRLKSEENMRISVERTHYTIHLTLRFVCNSYRFFFVVELGSMCVFRMVCRSWYTRWRKIQCYQTIWHGIVSFEALELNDFNENKCVQERERDRVKVEKDWTNVAQCMPNTQYLMIVGFLAMLCMRAFDAHNWIYGK